MLHCNKWILRITLWNLKLNKPLLIDHSFEDWDWEGVPNFRMEQVRDWIFEKGQLDWGKMSNLPKSLKEKLTERYARQYSAMESSIASFQETGNMLTAMLEQKD